MENNRISVLVSSCDAYSDIWDPFFESLSKHWVDLPYDVLLVTESKPYDCKWMDVRVFHTGDAPWTTRIRKALEHLQSKYVLFLLEDFFFEEDIDTAGLEQCADWMEQDDNITYFSFVPQYEKEETNKYEGYHAKPKNSRYRLHAMPALWRRARFLEFLQDDVDAWRWESQGNLRSFDVEDGFYSIYAEERSPIPWIHGIKGGKWFTYMKEYFEREKTNVDPEKRGYIEEKNWMLEPSMRSFLIVDSSARFGKKFSDVFRETKAEYAPDVLLEEGLLHQRFLMPQSDEEYCETQVYQEHYFFAPADMTSFMYWMPSDKSAAFNIKDFSVKLELEPGDTVDITGDLVTNYSHVVEQTNFLHLNPDDGIIVPLPDRGVCAVIIDGKIECPIPAELLEKEAEKQKEERHLRQRVWGIHKVTRDNYFKLKSRLYYSKDGHIAIDSDYLDYENEIVEQGAFRQEYELPYQCRNIQWTPVAYGHYFRIADLKVTLKTDGGEQIEVPYRDVHGSFYLHNDEFFFFHYPAYIVIPLPLRKYVVSVTFEGVIANPIDMETIKQVIWLPRKEFRPRHVKWQRLLERLGLKK